MLLRWGAVVVVVDAFFTSLCSDEKSSGWIEICKTPSHTENSIKWVIFINQIIIFHIGKESAAIRKSSLRLSIGFKQ